MKSKLSKALALLLALVLVIGCLAGCGGKETPTDPPVTDPPSTETPSDDTTAPPELSDHPRGGILKKNYFNLSPTVDPCGQGSWTTWTWSQAIIENPLVQGADGVIYPMVCEYKESEDGLQIDLWVREGVKFSDGTLVEIEDVLASLELHRSRWPNLEDLLWANVEKYEIKDGVLTFVLKEYRIDSLAYFYNPRPSTNGIMPKEICEKYATDANGPVLITDPADVIGTGPYKLDGDATIPGEKYVMTRNDNYVICEASPDENGYASPRRQYLDGIEVQKLDDFNAESMALMSGDLSFIFGDTDFYEKEMKSQGITEDRQPGNGAYYNFFNCADDRLVSDVNLRKAIAAALDFDEFSYSVLGENYKIVTSPITCGTAYETDAFTSQDWYGDRKANETLAKEYLAKSSYKGETLKLYSNADEGIPVIVDQLAKVGIVVEAQVLDNTTLIDYSKDQSLDWDIIFRTNPTGSNYPSAMDTTFYSCWGNARAEELIDLLKTVPLNSDQSIAYAKELQELMADEVPFVIVGSQVDYFNCVPGFHMNRQGTWRYEYNGWFDET